MKGSEQRAPWWSLRHPRQSLSPPSTAWRPSPGPATTSPAPALSSSASCSSTSCSCPGQPGGRDGLALLGSGPEGRGPGSDHRNTCQSCLTDEGAGVVAAHLGSLVLIFIFIVQLQASIPPPVPWGPFHVPLWPRLADHCPLRCGKPRLGGPSALPACMARTSGAMEIGASASEALPGRGQGGD